MNRKRSRSRNKLGSPVQEFHPEHQQLLSIFDAIDEAVYVADPDTYEILFMNKALKKIRGNMVGRRCYQAFQGLGKPCPFCTNKYIFGKAARPVYV